MAVEIKVNNLHINGNSRMLNKATLPDNTSLHLEGICISGDAVILNELNVAAFCDAIQATAYKMSASEYASIQKVLRKEKSGKDCFLKALRQHLVNFSEGVAASVVANWIKS